MNVISRRVAFTCAAALTLAACSASGPKSMDAGQRISERGGDISARGQSWRDGQRDQRKGQDLVKKSVDRISDGEKDLKKAHSAVTKAEQRIAAAQSGRAEGEQLISSGAQQMQRAEADYAIIKRGPSALAPR